MTQEKPGDILLDLLGNNEKTYPFVITTSNRSAFDEVFQRYNTQKLPCIHLVVAAKDDALTWEEAQEVGIATADLHLSIKKNESDYLILHYFDDTLLPQDAGTIWRAHDKNSARRRAIHAHLYIGHKDLFGDKGIISQGVSTLLRPELIVAETLKAMHSVPEVDFESFLENSASDQDFFLQLILKQMGLVK